MFRGSQASGIVVFLSSAYKSVPVQNNPVAIAASNILLHTTKQRFHDDHNVSGLQKRAYTDQPVQPLYSHLSSAIIPRQFHDPR